MKRAQVDQLPAGLGLSDARLRMYEAAVSLFGDLGYHGVSMRDLADAMGIKGASLYAHVPSKQHLLFEITRIGLTEHLRRIQAALLEAGSDPAEQMRALVHAHVLALLEFPALGRICNRELHHIGEPLLSKVVPLQDQSSQLFLDVVNRGRRLGEFSVEDPQRAMRAIADMGIRTAEWPRPEGTADAIAADYASYALRILR